MNLDERTRTLLLIVILGLLLTGAVLTGVGAHEESELSVTTDWPWYRKGETMIYNVSAPPGTNIHIILEPEDGGIYREVFAVTDENGTYENAFYTRNLWVGAWKIKVYDYDNHSAQVKIMVERNSEDIDETILMFTTWWKGFQGFLWQLVTAIGLISVIVIFAGEYRSAKRISAFTGEKTWADMISVSKSNYFKFPYWTVGLSRRGQQNELMMARKAYNELRWEMEENQEEINFIRTDMKMNSTLKKMKPDKRMKIFERLRLRIGYLEFQNSLLKPERADAKDSLISALVRAGEWTEDMSIEDEDSLLYGGEERKLVRTSG